MFTCGVCRGQGSRSELVEEVFRVDGRYVLVGGVPSMVCQRCGERSFSRETTEKARHQRPYPCRSTNLRKGPWSRLLLGSPSKGHAGLVADLFINLQNPVSLLLQREVLLHPCVAGGGEGVLAGGVL